MPIKSVGFLGQRFVCKEWGSLGVKQLDHFKFLTQSGLKFEVSSTGILTPLMIQPRLKKDLIVVAWHLGSWPGE